jgi:hypothetical protein
MRTAQIRRPLTESDVVVGLDFRNREKQQLEIGVTGVARFVRCDHATAAPAGCCSCGDAERSPTAPASVRLLIDG